MRVNFDFYLSDFFKGVFKNIFLCYAKKNLSVDDDFLMGLKFTIVWLNIGWRVYLGGMWQISEDY